MTVAELSALRLGVEAQKARGEKPTIAGAIAAGPGTLDAALRAEAARAGHVEFQKGAPVWVPGPMRFLP